MPKPTNQPSGVFVERTRLEILSVTVANVWPGPMTGCSTRAASHGAPRFPAAPGISGFGFLTAAR